MCEYIFKYYLQQYNLTCAEPYMGKTLLLHKPRMSVLAYTLMVTGHRISSSSAGIAAD